MTTSNSTEFDDERDNNYSNHHDYNEIETLLTYIIAGSFAGFTCDIILFPLDTLKTRIQSKTGFINSGGFKNIYAGIGPAAAG